jgi:hypothetical protein
MDFVAAIITSGVVAAIVSAVFKIWSDRKLQYLKARSEIVGAVLKESYAREAAIYATLWEKLSELEFALSELEMERSFVGPEAGNYPKEAPVPEGVAAASTRVANATKELGILIEKYRPFFHPDIYRLLERFQFRAIDQQMDPVMQSFGRGRDGFTYEQSARKIQEITNELEHQIRLRMTMPEASLLKDPGWLEGAKAVVRFRRDGTA